MTLVDANILLYAAHRTAPEHERARAWLDAQLSGTARVGLPWPSLLAFVRLAIGPSMPDRVVALDMIANLVVATTALYAITTEQQVLLDVAIGIALITFLGTVSFAQYIERRARND